MADLGAAFGFYPQLNRRRQGSPADSANLPIDVLRGRLAGLLGAPADIANLLRSPSPTEMFGDVSYEAPAQFPYTTEKFLKDLPLAPTSRIGQVAGQAASFVPLNPMPAVRGVQKVGQVVGEELAATMMGQRPNSMMSKVVPQPLFAVAPEGLLATKTEPIESLLQTKPQAPVSDIGFYSATEQAALNLGRNKGTGQSFINDLMKAPDVKKEELQFTGLDEFLRDKPNVTKQEVQDFLANNRVDVQETQLGGALSPEMQTTRDALNDKYKLLIDDIANAKSQFEEGKISYAQVRNTVSNNQIQIEALDAQINEINKTISPTKFDRYTLAGGENYREILLTLPQKKNEFPDFEQWLTNRYGGSQVPEGVRQAARKEYERQSSGLEISGGYQSSHFNEPNILAHMRVNDRIDADGKKMLLVEEIQSDWHQAGREKGYKTGKERNPAQVEKELTVTTQRRSQLIDEAAALPDSEMARFKTINEEIKKLGDQANKLNEEWTLLLNKPEGVPDAPFKDTWYQLALKRLTKYAADNGYERIGLTTGRQQAKRFDLGNEVNSIDVESVVGVPNLQLVDVDVIGGKKIALEVENGVVREGEFVGKRLSDVVGKEMADKITNVAQGEAKIFAGEDLRIGGEGMKKYYDEIYPKFLDKYGKKYGASVGETKIKTDNVPYVDYVVKQGYFNDHTVFGVEPNGTTTIINQNAANMAEAQALANRYKEKNLGGGETIRYLDITPQMKEGTSKGQPLFAATPLLPATSLLDEEKRKEITSLLE